MPTVQRTRLAEADLVEIATRIAEANPTAADEWLDLVATKCQLLAKLPELGRLRPELVPGIRSWVVGEYVIFYRPTPTGIVIARVLHGARDLPQLFPS